MHTTATLTLDLDGRLVDLDALVCPGCHEQVHPEQPTFGQAEAGFSHPDGSELCPDARGRTGEPIETPR